MEHITHNQESGSLQEAMDRYADMLFKIAYLRLLNVHDAEDVVQEVFWQYLQRTEGFEGPEHEKAWLIKVTLNACRKIWRSAWNRHRSADELEEHNIGEIRSASDDILGPEDIVAAEDERRQLLEAVTSLPPKYRDVIHLFYYEDMSIREIAGVTGRKESTVTSQLTRARELLRNKVREEYDFA